jgi:hypothetical protein
MNQNLCLCWSHDPETGQGLTIVDGVSRDVFVWPDVHTLVLFYIGVRRVYKEDPIWDSAYPLYYQDQDQW